MDSRDFVRGPKAELGVGVTGDAELAVVALLGAGVSLLEGRVRETENLDSTPRLAPSDLVRLDPERVKREPFLLAFEFKVDVAFWCGFV